MSLRLIFLLSTIPLLIQCIQLQVTIPLNSIPQNSIPQSSSSTKPSSSTSTLQTTITQIPVTQTPESSTSKPTTQKPQNVPCMQGDLIITQSDINNTFSINPLSTCLKGSVVFAAQCANVNQKVMQFINNLILIDGSVFVFRFDCEIFSSLTQINSDNGTIWFDNIETSENESIVLMPNLKTVIRGKDIVNLVKEDLNIAKKTGKRTVPDMPPLKKNMLAFYYDDTADLCPCDDVNLFMGQTITKNFSDFEHYKKSEINKSSQNNSDNWRLPVIIAFTVFSVTANVGFLILWRRKANENQVLQDDKMERMSMLREIQMEEQKGGIVTLMRNIEGHQIYRCVLGILLPSTVSLRNLILQALGDRNMNKNVNWWMHAESNLKACEQEYLAFCDDIDEVATKFNLIEVDNPSALLDVAKLQESVEGMEDKLGRTLDLLGEVSDHLHDSVRRDGTKLKIRVRDTIKTD